MIKNIIFDLGGVIIDLDTEATTRAFEQLGMKNFRDQYSQARQTGVFDEYDKGKITDTAFRNGLRNFLAPGQELTDRQIDDAWNAMLLHVPAHRLQLLSEMKTKYRTFLLSNTNRIHVREFSRQLHVDHGIHDFSGYFERWYYSCDIGMRKPDAEIFEFVLKENNLLASETIFIDDSYQHIEGAKTTGIHAHLLEAGTEVGLLLKKVL